MGELAPSSRLRRVHPDVPSHQAIADAWETGPSSSGSHREGIRVTPYERVNPLRPKQVIPRVYVVGLGLLTHLGYGVDTNVKAYAENANGITAVEDEDGEYAAGVIRDFNPEAVLSPFVDEKEIRRSVRAQHFALALALNALQDAGLVTEEGGKEKLLKLLELSRLAVIVGTGAGGSIGYAENALKVYGVRNGRPEKLNPFTDVNGAFIDQAVTSISRQFELEGQPIGTQSAACASGQAATTEGYKSIITGEADAAIVVGFEAPHHRVARKMFGRTGATTDETNPDVASIPFDKRRSGFVISEGGGAFVLMTGERMAQLGLHAIAEIAGYANVSGAGHPTNPSESAMYQAYSRALDYAGIREVDEAYFSSHATSTVAGDPSEARVIGRVGANRKIKHPVVSAPKATTGHLLGGAGIAEPALALGGMRRNIILGTREPRSGYQPIEEMEGLDFPMRSREGRMDVVVKGSFGFGDQNHASVFVLTENGQLPLERTGRIFTR